MSEEVYRFEGNDILNESGENVARFEANNIIGDFGGGGGDVPIATTTRAGKVKPDGTTISVAADGKISVISTGEAIFSTNEHIIGKWVDGRNVYQRTYVYSDNLTTGENHFDIDLPNLDRVVSVYGSVQRVSGVTEPLPMASTVLNWVISVFSVSSTSFGVVVGDNFTGSNALRNLTMTFTYVKSN